MRGGGGGAFRIELLTRDWERGVTFERYVWSGTYLLVLRGRRPKVGLAQLVPRRAVVHLEIASGENGARFRQLVGVQEDRAPPSAASQGGCAPISPWDMTQRAGFYDTDIDTGG